MNARHRPDILAHPSPAAGQFLLLVGVLLGSGLISGQLLHLAIFGNAYRAELFTCGTPCATGPQQVLRVVFAFGGAAAVAALGIAILAAMPVVLIHRYRLRPAGDNVGGAVGRIAELAAQTGVSPPQVMVGRAGQRDAFVFGLPGQYRLVLPTALLVRWRGRGMFDHVVRHELAHLRRHDVLLAWSASAAWLGAIPVMVLPLLSAIVRWDFTVAWIVLWQSALLLAVVWLLRRNALRSREHEADLDAARREGDWRPMWTTLQAAGMADRRLNPLRRLISNHPAGADRMRVLAEPATLRTVSTVDGFAAAFLASMLFPLLNDVMGWLLAAVVAGAVLGLAVGAGLWRQALIEHASGQTLRAGWPGGPVAGVVAGLLLGHLVNFGGTGARPAWDEGTIVLLTAVCGAGATMLSAGAGRLWADAAGRLSGRRMSWWVSLLVNAVLFAFALGAIERLVILVGTVVETGLPWSVNIIGGAGTIAPVMWIALVPAVVACYGLIARRRPAGIPRWLVDGPHTTVADSAMRRRPGIGSVLLSGVAPGAVAALGMLGHRLAVGSPVDDDDRISRYLIWLTIVVLVALAVSFVTLIAIPRSGPAIGVLNGAVAVFCGVLGILAVNTLGFGNPFIPSVWWTALSTMMALWFIGYQVMLPLSLASWPAPWRDVPGWLLAVLTLAGGGLASLSVTGIAIAIW